LTSALHGGKWPASHPDCFTLRAYISTGSSYYISELEFLKYIKFSYVYFGNLI